MKQHKCKSLTVVGLTVVMLAIAPAPDFFVPEPVPVSRVKANLEARIAEDGGDWNSHYQLGRLHTMVAVLGIETVIARVNERDITVYPLNYQQGQQVETRKISEEDRIEHFDAAIRHMRTAYVLQRQNPLVVLSYAYLMEQAESHASELTETPLRNALELSTDSRDTQPRDLLYTMLNTQDLDQEKLIRSIAIYSGEEEFLEHAFQGLRSRITQDDNRRRRELAKLALQRLWQLQTVDLYYEACASASRDELRTGAGMHGLEGLVTQEAADAFERLVNKWELADPYRLAVVKDIRREALEVPRAVTPIIFSLSALAPLESLLAPETVVRFDLDGTGREQSWPWVSPEASILVWDPEETVEVTSGRQLFGSVTWWLFFDDGYRAMDALDDNRDGELAGDELAGLGVWTDANSNGISDPGEVVPIGLAGIKAISCRQTDTTMGMPANLTGLRMTDGRVLPTYDWVATEVSQEPAETVGVGS